jgi:hypothetical protein
MADKVKGELLTVEDELGLVETMAAEIVEGLETLLAKHAAFDAYLREHEAA